MKTVWKTAIVALGVFLSAMALGALFQAPANAATLNGREFTHSIVPVPICDMTKVDAIVSNVIRITRITGEDNSQVVLDTIIKL